MIVDAKYDALASRPSDINEHFPTLRRYATGAGHVVEMGVRGCVSTWALLAGRPRRLTSIDLFDPGRPVVDVSVAAIEADVEFRFVCGDTLAIDIEPCDVLLIDTWHAYAQLIRELRRHAPQVRRYILLHDTTLFSTQDEPAELAASAMPPRDDKQGLWTAVEDFLDESPAWRLWERLANNNGLTVLRRT
jgi:hypothetical protein